MTLKTHLFGAKTRYAVAIELLFGRKVETLDTMKKSIITMIIALLGAVGLFVVKVRMVQHKPSELDALKLVDNNNFQDGDIIFQTSTSSQSKAIQLATHSRYSHMGIIFERDGQYFVYEAVQPVKFTKLDDWIKRGVDFHFVLKRLKDRQRLLTNENLKKMKSVGEKFVGRDYDIYFEWTDSKIYCSELVWKIYKEALDIEIGNLQELKEFDLTHNVVRKKMQERYGNNIPLHEKVISPSAMFDSDKLFTVKEN